MSKYYFLINKIFSWFKYCSQNSNSFNYLLLKTECASRIHRDLLTSIELTNSYEGCAQLLRNILKSVWILRKRSPIFKGLQGCQNTYLPGSYYFELLCYIFFYSVSNNLSSYPKASLLTMLFHVLIVPTREYFLYRQNYWWKIDLLALNPFVPSILNIVRLTKISILI